MNTTTLAAILKATAVQTIFPAWAKMIGRPKAETMRKQVRKPATSNAPFGLLKEELEIAEKPLSWVTSVLQENQLAYKSARNEIGQKEEEDKK